MPLWNLDSPFARECAAKNVPPVWFPWPCAGGLPSRVTVTANARQRDGSRRLNFEKQRMEIIRWKVKQSTVINVSVEQ